MTGGQTIDYEALHQEAMRGVVRSILVRTAKSGLPGEHHFYISFDTTHAGVILSKRLKEKYPQEMTIVLQHRFWDLAVTDERFEVKLTFDGIPERLVIPFAAIKVFFDPSVRYGLQFEEPELIDGGEPGRPVGGDDIADARTAVTTRTQSPRKPRTPPRAKPRSDKEPTGPAAAGESKGPQLKTVPSRPAAATQNDKSTGDDRAASTAKTGAHAVPGGQRSAAGEDGKPAPAAVAVPQPGAQIVSLDAFRKK